jgi:hypothetical protein
LRIVNSYWFNAIPLFEKLSLFRENYLLGLSPAYWYLPNGRDLARHLMDGFGHILVVTLPFAVVGLVVCLRNFRSSPHRMILIATLVSPLGGAMAETGVTRALVFVVPAAMLTTLGLETALHPLFRRRGAGRLDVVVLAALALTNLFLLNQALLRGPRWTTDYGIGGMQYGARQVFGEIGEVLEEDEQRRVLLTPTWANGTDILARYFYPDEPRLALINIDGILGERQPLDDQVVVIMTPDEYDRALADPKLAEVSLDRVLPYPDGRPGFYFARLDYSQEADAIWAAEQEARRQPVSETIQLLGMDVVVAHSRFEEGLLLHVFDGDAFSLVRTAQLNPAVFVLEFPVPVAVSGVRVTTGTMDVGLTATLIPHDGSEPQVFLGEYVNQPADPTVDLEFQETPTLIDRLELRIENLGDNEAGRVHVREVELH